MSDVLPFTVAPAIQADIRRELRGALEQAERGELLGIFLVKHDRTDEMTSIVIGEQRFTLMGAVFQAVVRHSQSGYRDAT